MTSRGVKLYSLTQHNAVRFSVTLLCNSVVI